MATKLLQEIYDEHVVIDENEMTENTEIAESFMKGFCVYMQRQGGGEQPQRVKQGSAFEGLKICQADEFDYILVYVMGERSKFITSVEVRNVPNIPHEAGYWRLTVGHPSWVDTASLKKRPLLERPWYQKWVRYDNSTGISIPVLSPAQFRRHIQKYLSEYLPICRLKGISSISRASFANPAFTVVLTKSDGDEISIDISIGVKIKINDEHTKTYFAKKHRRDERGRYWGVTYHEKEMALFRRMDQSERKKRIKKNYRITKLLLTPVVGNSFVLKTAFLHLLDKINDDLLKTKKGFLEAMIERLRKAYRQKALPGFYNQSVYNVLGKYNDEELEKMATRFNKFKNRTKSEEDMIELIEALLEDAIESETDTDSDSTDTDSDE